MRRLAVAAAGLLGGGCAFVNPDNRPTWNLVEQNLVPDSDGWFYATLPLTAPIGLAAIVVDSVLVHPLQVVDDAAADAGDVWERFGNEIDEHYYTRMASVPFRAAWTPVVFVTSFLGRSMFDIREPKAKPEPEAPSAAEQQAAATAAVRGWLQDLAAGRRSAHPGARLDVWDEELRGLLAATLQTARPAGRYEIYRAAAAGKVPADVVAPTAGLRDPDPVVRYRVLGELPAGTEIDEDLRRQLGLDPSQWIRDTVERRWPPQ